VILGQEQLLLRGSRRPGFFGYALLTPMLLWLAFFVLAPAIVMLVYSFCQRDEFGDLVFEFTTENYRRVFSPLYLRILLRSIALAGLTATLCLLIGYPCAFFIARCHPAWRSRLLLLVMLPFWTSFLIRIYAWITIFKQEGLLNAALESLHIVPNLIAPTRMMYTPSAVVVGMVYTFLPFMILPVYGSVEQLRTSLVEAAMDLGAGPVRTFLKVVLPLTAPGISAGMLLVFVPSIGMFAITDLLGGAKVPMVGNVIQNQFGQARDVPFGAALGTTLLAFFMLVFLLLTRRPRTT
jgi:spermidine/putrescine transport system permease protein